MSAGAGIVVSRAVIRDMFPPADAQRVMSQVTIYFGVAPAVAPIVGGLLFVHVGWHVDLLVPHGVGVVLWRAQLEAAARDAARDAPAAVQSVHLLRGYWQLGSQPALPAARAGERRARSTACSSTCSRRRSSWASILAPGADAVLLVLPAHHQRHHGRRLRLGAAGRADRADAADPLRLRRSWSRSSLLNLALERAVPRRSAGGRCCRSRSSPSAGR